MSVIIGPAAIDAKVAFRCPFCTSVPRPTVAVGTDVASGQMAITHALPMCPEFERLDVLEFLTACRKRMSP
jgi:hypothetical protein